MTDTMEFSYRKRRRRSAPGPLVAALVVFLLVGSVQLPSASAISAGTPRGGARVVSGTPQTKKSNPAGDTTAGDRKNSEGSKNNDETGGKRRGKVLGERFDERDLLRAYEEIKTEYYEMAFGGCVSPEQGEFPTEDQQDWKLLTTMNPNKKKNKKRKSSGEDEDDEEDDEIIKVSMLEHPSDPLCPYVKMETVIPMPLDKCWDFLSLGRWDETMPKMDPFYEGLDIFGEYSIRSCDVEGSFVNTTDSDKEEEDDESSDMDVVKMILARKRTKRILTFGKREFVFVSVEDTPLEDGTWVSGTVSVEVKESGEGRTLDTSGGDGGDSQTASPSLRRNKQYTRAFQDSIAFYKPLPAKGATTETENNVSRGRTKITIVCRIDLNDSSGEHGGGGCIPMWLYVKTIGVTGAKSVLSMRKCLLEDDDSGSK